MSDDMKGLQLALNLNLVNPAFLFRDLAVQDDLRGLLFCSCYGLITIFVVTAVLVACGVAVAYATRAS